jgi:hypothetical protein
MKIAIHLLLTAALISTVSCSTLKTEVVATNQENVNIVQEPSNSAAQSDISLGGAVPLNEVIQQAGAPEALIADLYKAHEKGNAGIVNGKSRKLLDKYFDKNLANLIWKDITTHQDEIGVIDFDIFYNTQDPLIKNLKVGSAKIEGSKATVPVTFTNGGAKETVTYTLVQQNSQWKISDIRYRENQTLLKYFKEYEQNKAAETSSAEGNFEGTYQVGETIATVKPTKMAFELKWAKGAGTMMFFYTGQGVLEYSSEDKGNGVDTFIFDDTSFTSGKFIRGSDGKEMTVKKIS